MTHIPVMTAEVLQLSAPRTGRTVRRLHGRARRPLARAARSRRLARSSGSIAISTRWRARAKRWRPGAIASSWCTPTIATIDDVLEQPADRPRRRRARRSRRLVDAVRRARPRLQLPARRAARHAHGSHRRRDGGRPGRARRASAISPTRFFSTAKSGSRAASRARSSKRAARRRSTRPAGWRRSSAAPSRTRRPHAHRSGDAHVPGAAHLGEPRARRPRSLRRDRRPPAARRRAAGRDHVSLARGSHREAHAARAPAARRPGAGADEEAAGRRPTTKWTAIPRARSAKLRAAERMA